MMIDYFKTNRSIQEQYTWQDIEALQWQGDETLQCVYTRWKLITTSLSITILEVVLRDTSLCKICSSKKLQVDIVEFDRMREDDSRRNLKWLTAGIDRLLARDRMEWARKLQMKSLMSGAIDSDSAPQCSWTRKSGKGKRKKKVKAKAKGSGIRLATLMMPQRTNEFATCTSETGNALTTIVLILTYHKIR